MPALAPRHPRTVIIASAIALVLGASLSGCTALGEFVLDRFNEVGQGGEQTEQTEGVYDGGDTSLVDMEVGQCVGDDALFGSESIASLDTVDCDGPHSAELYALWDLPAGDYPGYDEVDTTVIDGCEARFAEYVGAPSADTDLDFYYFSPTLENWDLDREAMCFAIDFDEEPLTGTVKDRGASEPVPSEG